MESFEQKLNEVRSEECSDSHAKALGFVQARAKGPVNLHHEHNLFC